MVAFLEVVETVALTDVSDQTGEPFVIVGTVAEAPGLLDLNEILPESNLRPSESVASKMALCVPLGQRLVSNEIVCVEVFPTCRP